MLSFKNSRKTQRKSIRGEYDRQANPAQPDNESFQSDILNMQSIIGNQAVMQMMRQGNIHQSSENRSPFSPRAFKIQRMPTADELQSAIEQAPAESLSSQTSASKIQRMPSREDFLNDMVTISNKNSKNYEIYKDILRKLQDLTGYKQQALGETRKDIQAQFLLIKFKHDDIEAKAEEFVNRNTSKKFKKPKLKAQIAYFKGLIDQSKQEKAELVPIMLKLSNNTELLLEQPSLEEAIEQASGEMGVQTLNTENKTGETSGGMNSVRFYEEGAFKAPKMQLPDEILDQAGQNGGVTVESNALENELMVAGKNLGLRQRDSLVNREIAMSYLDQLLGAGVLVHTERALESDGENIQEGVIMEMATGQTLSSMANEQGHEAVDQNPQILRDLSKIQLLDVLGRQIDRHTGNYVILKDPDGNITGLKGFDHDMSFGRTEGIAVNELPGIAKYVDKELAMRIITLNPEMLVWVLEGLLLPDVIEMTLTRLIILQEHLLEHQDKLLEPGQWEEAVASGAIYDDEQAYINSTRHWAKADREEQKRLKKNRGLFNNQGKKVFS